MIKGDTRSLDCSSWGPHVIVTRKANKDYIGSSYIPIIPLLQGGGSS